MGLFDEITNFASGGQQKGYGDMERMLQQGWGGMQKYGEQANSLMNPFYQAGMGQINPYMQNFQKMLNPGQFYNDMMKGYEMSPSAQNQMREGNRSALNAASASGMLGSDSLMQDVNKFGQGVMRGDQQNYFNNMMNTWNQGLGHQQGMMGMGYGAGGQMGSNMMNMGRGMMDAYNGMGQAQMGQQMAKQGGIQNMISMLMKGGGMGF